MSGLGRRVKAMLPAALRLRADRARLMARLQRERFSTQQRRTNSLISVPGLAGAPRRHGSVWGVCLARNEADVIAHSVRHMLSQGLDGVIVVDNLSTDGTAEILRDLAAADPRIHVGDDRQIAFHQGAKTSYLSHLAWRSGADWVVPFDADEFWFAEDGSVASFLRAQTASSVWCDFRNVLPSTEAGEIDFDRGGPVQVEAHENAWLRISFRARRWVWVGEGNHALRDPRDRPVRGLHMLHYSYRSLEQYCRKVDSGVEALEAAGKDATIATHWRRWARLDDAERRTLWQRYLAGEHFAVDFPAPASERVIIDDPVRWKRWDPDGVFVAAR